MSSCGLHIHSGSSCEAASEVGGHYATNGFADPWTEKSLSYVSSTNGNAEGKLSAVTGGTSLDVLGKAFVVHGYDGGRIACGTLEYCDPCGPPPPPANVCKPSPFFRIGPPVVGATASEEAAVARALPVA